MRIAPDFYARFLQDEDISLCAVCLKIKAVILRGAEGFGKSQNPSSQKVPSPSRVCVDGSSSKTHLPSAREVILHLKEPSLMGEGEPLAVGHGEDTIKGIFPKRPEKM